MNHDRDCLFSFSAWATDFDSMQLPPGPFVNARLGRDAFSVGSWPFGRREGGTDRTTFKFTGRLVINQGKHRGRGYADASSASSLFTREA